MTSASSSSTPRVIFNYDIVCPYAYICSRRIEQVVKRANPQVRIEWTPVLLGGLYKLDAAPQGKDGSATAVMSPSKRLYSTRDLNRTIDRFNIPFNYHPNHPLRSIDAMRLLCATQPMEKRVQLSHELYAAYWVRNEDITDHSVLARYAEKFHIDPSLLSSTEAKNALETNTKECSDRGGFGVPCIFIQAPGANKDEFQFFFGQDRLPLVEHALGGNKQRQLAKTYFPKQMPTPRVKVRFFYDFASPWTFLAHTQLRQLESIADVTCSPVLVGIIFRSVGMANTPMTLLTDRKRAQQSRDLTCWSEWLNEPIVFPSFFPIRTVLPCRVAIVEPKTRDCIFRAAWQKEQNIGEEEALLQVLNTAGFDGAALIKQSQSENVKTALKRNTEEALKAGVFGVPSFIVGEDELVFGQDRLDVVQDLCSGWKPKQSYTLFRDEMSKKTLKTQVTPPQKSKL